MASNWRSSSTVQGWRQIPGLRWKRYLSFTCFELSLKGRSLFWLINEAISVHENPSLYNSTIWESISGGHLLFSEEMCLSLLSHLSGVVPAIILEIWFQSCPCSTRVSRSWSSSWVHHFLFFFLRLSSYSNSFSNSSHLPFSSENSQRV